MDESAEKPRGSNMKSWRLVVRNLPFDSTKEDLMLAFSKYGEVAEVNLPKCRDKRFPKSCAGFCFVQYAKKKSAESALTGISTFKDRKLSVAWALDKDNFITKQTGDDEKIKMENKLKVVLSGMTKKAEKRKAPSSEVKTDGGSAKNKMKLEIQSQMSDSDNEETNEKSREVPEKKSKSFKADLAVLEERVVFLRNLDFNATTDMLKEVAGKFGTVTLAIQCKYPGTDQPCGTAFVHFKEKSGADAFLNQLLKPDGIEINGRQVYGHRAVPRATAANEFATRTKKEPKDKRNLQLLRASLIREGTLEARGMSENDIQLRKRLILQAKNKLKDLTKFVSPTRLALHNLPFSLNDNQLRVLCLEAAKNPNAKITEVRIMRDTVGQDDRGHVKLGRSKGFGFVAFSEHTDALACLRALNNNSKTFTSDRRPIVEFSIENLNALRAKEKRSEDFKQRQLQKESSNQVKLSNKKRVVFTPSASLSDPSALVETKRQLMSGGRKWLPKRLGQKVRHRDLKDKKLRSKNGVGRKPKGTGNNKNKRVDSADGKKPSIGKKLAAGKRFKK